MTEYIFAISYKSVISISNKDKLFRLLVVAASLFVRSYLNDLMTLGLAGGFDSGFGEIPSVFLQKLDKAFRGL